MREYAKVSPTFWTGETGKQIRAMGPDCLVIALYLLTGPHSNMYGLYYLPTPFIAHETGIPLEGALEALARLSEVDFCRYDTASEWVFVVEMARYQVLDGGAALKKTDNRVAGIRKGYATMPNNPFLLDFFERYSEDFHLEEQREGKKKVSPSEAPLKPLRSKEKEQEQEREKEQEKEKSEKPLSATADVALDIILKNETLFHITKADVTDWVKLFPKVDVIDILAQIQKTCTSNPAKRKDESGIRAHIVGCLKMMNERKETFERIWNRYPAKDGKKEAERHFRATVQTEEDLKDIHKALDNYLEELRRNPTRPPKNGSTWFNNWRDWVNWEPPVFGKGAAGDKVTFDQMKQTNIKRTIGEWEPGRAD